MSEGTEEMVEENAEPGAEAVEEPAAAPVEDAQDLAAEPAEEIAAPPEELKFPRVIDLEALLRPIPGENPCGENVRYSGIYDEINEARRADKDVAQGEWQTELKLADFPRVIHLALPVLSNQTKDMQITAYLTEALVKEYQFVGLRDSLKLMALLQEKFWDTIYPEIEEGDMEGRANAVEWMDSQTAFAIREASITQGNGYSFLDWEDSKRFDFPDNIDTLELAEQQKIRNMQALVVKENRTTADLWKKAVSVSRRAFYEDLAVIIAEIWVEFREINRIIEAKFDPKQMPGLSNLKKSLETIEAQVKILLSLKREEEPDETDEADEAEAEGGSAAGGKSFGGADGAIQGRGDALKRLAQLAEYFRKAEPHSPVSYLVTRAVKWGSMPLETWLQDVIKDETVLYQIRQTLGFNTGTGDSTEETAVSSEQEWQ